MKKTESITKMWHNGPQQKRNATNSKHVNVKTIDRFVDVNYSADKHRRVQGNVS